MKKLILLSALLIFACSDDEGNPCVYEPTLTTEAATNITETSATLNGTIDVTSENCEVAPGEMQGFVYSANPSPTTDDNVEVIYGTDISASIEGLEPENTYYVRAFLTNTIGEFYGDEVSFMTDTGEPADCDIVYLASNGVTIKACSEANLGDVGVIDGIQYTVVSREMLEDLIASGGDLSKICTTYITNLSGNIDNWQSFFGSEDGVFDNLNNLYDGQVPSIVSWDVSNVTDMSLMFYLENSFNQPIGDWDVSNVTNMQGMFPSSAFNQPIGDWDVSNVTDMKNMFTSTLFNQPIGDWDVSNVTDMFGMFFSTPFNQPIGDWDVSSVTNMYYMFGEADAFNRDLSSWVVDDVFDCEAFSDGATSWTLPQPNFIL